MLARSRWALAGLALVFSVTAQPANARWVTEHLSDDGVYAASVKDELGMAQVQLHCSIDYPGEVVLVVYTAEPFDSGTSYAEEVPLSIIVDGRTQPVVNGIFEEFAGELLVTASTYVDETLAPVVAAMANGRRSIRVEFFERDFLFLPDGLDSAIRYLAENCE
jgi:hypothetical protein